MAGHNVAALLRRQAHSAPDRIALAFPAARYTDAAPAWDTWSYRRLDEESDALARGLAAEGVRPGDRAVVLVRPSLELYALLFALFKVGAVPVLLDPGMGMRALLACIERNAPRVLVAASAVHAVRVLLARRAFATVEMHVTVGRRWFWGGVTSVELRKGGDPFRLVDRAAEDPAAILFTSGSTGPAKGVVSTQAMFAAQVEALRRMFDLTPGQIDLQCFAAFAIFDLSLGLTSVIPKMDLARPATADPRAIVAAVRAHEPEIAFASPIVWRHASRHCVENGITFPSIRTLLTVGAPIAPELHRRMRRILPPGAQVHTPYGATEAMPITSIGTDEILEDTAARTATGAGTCVGRPAPGAEVRIAPITDGPIPRWSDDLAAAPGTLGEIVAGGPQVSPAYAEVEAVNAAAKIAHGDRILHRMGDLGYVDAAGRLWFCGRKAHRLVVDDTTVLPSDAVEAIFDEHPGVLRTALVGLGPRGRQIPVLCVEMERGRPWSSTVEDELRALARGTVAEGRIARFLPHPGFPTDARHNSKIRREELVPWAARRCRDLAAPTSRRHAA
jgi:acyl-CoA synthetase (AMP-forming)/AMP-acid ligase II